MSDNPVKKSGRGARGLICLALVLSMCLSALPLLTFDTVATPIPATISSPMNITANTDWNSGTCILSANLTVKSPATLKIQNVTIDVVNNWTGHQGGGGGGNKSADQPFVDFTKYFGIKVESGAKLVIFNSTIKGKTKSDTYNIIVAGTVDLRSSTFKNLDYDGIFIDGDNGVDPIITGNTFSSVTDGLYINDTSSNVNNNTFSSVSNVGLFFTNADLTISDNEFTSTQTAISGQSSTCAVDNNDITASNYGVYVYLSDCAFRNFTIQGVGYGNTGIYVDYPDPSYGVYDNEVFHFYTGVLTYGSATISYNHIHDDSAGIQAYNGGGGNKTGGPGTTYVTWNNLTTLMYNGIVINQVNNIVAENNTLTSIGDAWDEGRGFSVGWTSGIVADNTITDIYGAGFELEEGANNVIFANNIISDLKATNQGGKSSATGAVFIAYAGTYTQWDFHPYSFLMDNVAVAFNFDNAGIVNIWDYDLTAKGIGTVNDISIRSEYSASVVSLYDVNYDGYTLEVMPWGGQAEASITEYWTTYFTGLWEHNNGPVDMGSLTVTDKYGQQAFQGDTDGNGFIGPFYLATMSEKKVYNYNNGSQTSELKVFSPYGFLLSKDANGRTYTNQTNVTIKGQTNVSMSLDDVFPFISITSPIDGYLTNQTTIEVTGNTEPLAHVTINNVNAKVDASGNFDATIGLDKDGKNTITVISMDKGKNQFWRAINVTRDTIAPVLGVDFPEQDGIYKNMTLTVTGQTEVGAFLKVQGKNVSIDQNGSWKTDVTYTKEGTNSVTVVSHDLAGNTVFVTRTFTIDITPPTLLVAKPTNNTLTKMTSVDVSGYVEKDAKVTVNGHKIVFDGTTFTTPVELVEGSNLITVTATDAAGNSKTTKVTVVRDSVPPVLTVVNPPDNLRTAKFSIVVNGTTEKGATVKINGIETDNINGTFSDTVFLNEGSNKITVEASDAAGNTVSKTRKVFKEAGGTADPISVISPANGTVIAGTTVTIKGSLNNEGILIVNGKQVTVDTNDNFEYIVALKEGNNVISLSLTDNFGNNYTLKWNLVRDTTPPEITITSPKSSVGQANVLVQGLTEPGSSVMVNGLMVYVSSTGDFTAPVTLNPGDNKIYITAVDKVGNAKTVTRVVKYTPKGGVGGLDAGSAMTLGLMALLIVLVIVIMVLMMVLMSRLGKGGSPKAKSIPEEETEEDEPEDDDVPTLEKEEEAPKAPSKGATAKDAPKGSGTKLAPLHKGLEGSKEAPKDPVAKPLPPPLPQKKSGDVKVEVKK